VAPQWAAARRCSTCFTFAPAFTVGTTQGLPAETTKLTVVPALSFVPGLGLRLRTPPRWMRVEAAYLRAPTEQDAARTLFSTVESRVPSTKAGTTQGGGGATTVVCALAASSGGAS